MPRVGEQDAFEQAYRAKLDSLLTPHGLLVEYAADRAAIDVGLHLFKRGDASQAREVSDVRVWFQCKGVRSGTLPAEDFAAAGRVAVTHLPIDHVRFWYAAAEPVYLVLYIESVGVFLAEDVRVLVDDIGGMPKLAEVGATEQKTITLHIGADCLLDHALARMPLHRSLRVDGPAFRGRPLGHRYDPLRSELEQLAPDNFEAIVHRILEVHDYRPSREISLQGMLDRDIGRVSASVGQLYLTYEWTTPLATQFGMDGFTDFRVEARPASAHGRVLVVVHSEVKSVPRRTPAIESLVSELEELEVEHALVLFNAPDLEHGLFGSWRMTLAPMVHTPQGLGSLAFNVLTATLIYLEFVDRLQWRYVNYL